MQRLTGKVILVAGGGAIGSALTRRFCAEGASVVLGDIDPGAAKAVEDEIGDAVCATLLDGADEDSIQAAVALALERFGGLDGLHANFAEFSGSSDITDTTTAVFDEVMRVNARGFLLCTRAALPHIVARGGGSIVYTSSAAAYLAQPHHLSYAMSKAAGHALMRHVAHTFGPQGVRANTIAPGLIRHADWSAETEATHNVTSTLRAIKRRGEPTDIAAMSALLMSDEGSFVTGQVISVDGGRVMRP